MINITKCECGGEFRVYDSRLLAGGAIRYRRKECRKCHKRITTYETSEPILPKEEKKHEK